MEAYHAFFERIPVSYALSGVWWAVGLSLLYTVFKYVFSLFAGKKTSVLAVLAPVLLLAFLFRNRALESADEITGHIISVGMIAVITYLLWLLLQFVSEKPYPGILLCVLSDVVMIFVYFNGGGIFGETFTGRIVFAALLVLSLSLLRPAYPFACFFGLFVCIVLIPVRKEPIDWNPVINAANRVVDKTMEAANSFTYYLSDLKIGSTYQTGYSSLAQSGISIRNSDRIELNLKSVDNTTYKYTDEETGKEMMRRRTVYLTGGKDADKDQLLDIMFALYGHDVDISEANLFLRRARLDISYVYLKTGDEILPVCALKAVDERGKPLDGTGKKKHRKGYSYRTEFIDLDYGSSYLTDIMRSPGSLPPKDSVNYRMLSLYSYNTYGLNLKELVSEEQYNKWQGRSGPGEEYLDISGATGRMKELAPKITQGCDNDYDKTRAIEAYLRQYAYSTDTGAWGSGDTGSPEGMSRMADSFLFEHGQGYCVHYASAMVMLLRLNGIPARYENGYRYVFPFDRQDVYEVSAGCAHAWPSAYIEGFGWVGFEPTSVYSTALERTWHRKPAESVYAKEAPDTSVNVKAPYPAPAVTVTDTADENGKPDKAGIREAARIAALIIAAVLLMAGLLIWGTLMFKAVRYRRAGPDRRLIMDVSDMTALIRLRSAMPLEDRGLMSDYEPYIPEKYRDALKDAFDVYYRIRYSCASKGEEGITVSPEEEKKARDLRNAMFNDIGGKKWILRLLLK